MGHQQVGLDVEVPHKTLQEVEEPLGNEGALGHGAIHLQDEQMPSVERDSGHVPTMGEGVLCPNELYLPTSNDAP